MTLVKVSREECFNPSNSEATYICPKNKEAKIFENHQNTVLLVFIG